SLMQKLQLEQKLGHKLSGQQIQFIKLLQIPTPALNDYIAKEVADNPLLDDEKIMEETKETLPAMEELYPVYSGSDYCFNPFNKKHYTIDHQNSYENWKPATLSFQESLKEQFGLLSLGEEDYLIGEQIIGSLDQNGYLHYDLEVIVQDLYVNHQLEVSFETVQKVLSAVQSLDPPGIGARNLQECLLIQLNRQNKKEPTIDLARQIISNCFAAFTKKHYSAMVKKLMLPNIEALKKAVAHILTLNPKPGWDHSMVESSSHFLTPDFIIIENQGKLSVDFCHYPTYKPSLNKKYLYMLEDYEKKEIHNETEQEMVSFLKKKVQDGKWFMEALVKRRQTLLKTMSAIVELQHRFFVEGEEVAYLIPMILQHVSDKIGMDPSTVSRIVNQKSVQGRFGIYPLKFFFSEGIKKSNGEDVSTKVIKKRILELIQQENKQKPYTDEHIVTLLTQEGYDVARRTIAKYREQLRLPVARLRKGLT
ncbi:MAG: RNA polymerase factor sigma-54, partial [Amoebophilaceae bacterium]|nr:RNA polymerase factor sigma-54 [Amoebophilaceae bacterium]